MSVCLTLILCLSVHLPLSLSVCRSANLSVTVHTSFAFPFSPINHVPTSILSSCLTVSSSFCRSSAPLNATLSLPLSVCPDLVRIFAPVLVAVFVSPRLYLPHLLFTPLPPLQRCCWLCSTWNNKTVLTFPSAAVASDGHGASHPFAFPRPTDRPRHRPRAGPCAAAAGRRCNTAHRQRATTRHATPRRPSGSLYPFDDIIIIIIIIVTRMRSRESRPPCWTRWN